MLIFFASLAISRVNIRDTDIDLVKTIPDGRATITKNIDEYKVVNLSITENNEIKWITEIRDYHMKNPEDITKELSRQYTKGLLPKDLEKTKVLLKIDKQAQWEYILNTLFAVRKAGFNVYPVYNPAISSLDQSSSNNLTKPTAAL